MKEGESGFTSGQAGGDRGNQESRSQKTEVSSQRKMKKVESAMAGWLDDLLGSDRNGGARSVVDVNQARTQRGASLHCLLIN